ncbi:MAG: hypothetical protein M1813_008530 [Trichoglossum hirsutum]|nr:MAG: hypothetical protein M1813_008530 [Trichoglossum hirsutum]
MYSPLSTTPPDRNIQLSSPPSSNGRPSAPVLRALGLFRRHRKYQLLDGDEDLKGWIKNKIPYDYDPVECLLALRMTTLPHEVLLRTTLYDINSHLRTIAAEVPEELASILTGITDQGRGHVFLWGETSTRNWRNVTQRCPDASFRHPSMRYPRVIIEVSYSQQRKPLEYLADSYITDSLGGVGVVIGLDLEYNDSSESKVMVWRPKFTEEGEKTILTSELVVSQNFRDPQGHALSGCLTLPVSDFLLPSSISGPPPQQNITISFSSLSDSLTKGFALESITKQRRVQPPDRPPSWMSESASAHQHHHHSLRRGRRDSAKILRGP